MSSDDPQIDLHPEALEKEMIFIPGVGPTPGIMNMVVRQALELLESVDEVEVFCCFSI